MLATEVCRVEYTKQLPTESRCVEESFSQTISSDVSDVGRHLAATRKQIHHIITLTTGSCWCVGSKALVGGVREQVLANHLHAVMHTHSVRHAHARHTTTT